MTDHTADIAAGAEPKAGIGASIPPVLKRALALVAHAGVSCGVGLLVGGLAGSDRYSHTVSGCAGRATSGAAARSAVAVHHSAKWSKSPR